MQNLESSVIESEEPSKAASAFGKSIEDKKAHLDEAKWPLVVFSPANSKLFSFGSSSLTAAAAFAWSEEKTKITILQDVPIQLTPNTMYEEQLTQEVNTNEIPRTSLNTREASIPMIEKILKELLSDKLKTRIMLIAEEEKPLHKIVTKKLSIHELNTKSNSLLAKQVAKKELAAGFAERKPHTFKDTDSEVIITEDAEDTVLAKALQGASEAIVLHERTECTREVQYQFESLIKSVQATATVTPNELKTMILPKIQSKYVRYFEKASTVGDVFIIISALEKWFHFEIIEHIICGIDSRSSACRAELTDYEGTLKHYFEKRVTLLEDLEKEKLGRTDKCKTFLLYIDDAWDEEVLTDQEQCNKLCEKIMQIFQSNGSRVTGIYKRPLLYIHLFE